MDRPIDGDPEEHQKRPFSDPFWEGTRKKEREWSCSNRSSCVKDGMQLSTEADLERLEHVGEVKSHFE